MGPEKKIEEMLRRIRQARVLIYWILRILELAWRINGGYDGHVSVFEQWV